MEKQEPKNLKIGISFSGIDPNSREPIPRTPEEIQRREEYRQKQAEAFASHEREMFRLNVFKIRPTNREQLRIVQEILIQDGITRGDFEELFAKVTTEREQLEKRKSEAQQKSQAEEQERNKFPAKFKRLASYIKIPLYEKDLSTSAQKASLQERLEARQALMTDMSRLSTEQRALALAWINAKISEKQLEAQKQTEINASLSRGLTALFRKH